MCYASSNDIVLFSKVELKPGTCSYRKRKRYFFIKRKERRKMNDAFAIIVQQKLTYENANMSCHQVLN